MGRIYTAADIAKFNKTHEALEARIAELEQRVAALTGAQNAKVAQAPARTQSYTPPPAQPPTVVETAQADDVQQHNPKGDTP